MAILLSKSGGAKQWQQAVSGLLPEIPVYIYPDIPQPDDIHYALLWRHPPGDLQRYANLRAVFSLGAGMEHLLIDPDLPDVPLVSLGDPQMSQDMANHTLYWVINYHRHYDQYRRQQAGQCWQELKSKRSDTFNVLILGLGRIGTHVAQRVQQAGFATKGWDFKAKQAESVESHHGMDALYGLLRGTDVVVCCLALNERSQYLLGDAFFAQLPAGSHLINISRGDVVDEEALRRALDTGQLAGAALDVMHTEPLPEGHWLWMHPGVALTPHMAGPTRIRSAAGIITANIRRMENGQLPEPVFDRNRGRQV
jgi:glyoxylate/hydroxypyruvate reductase A